MSSGSTVFTCRPVADNKQYVASLHAGHKKGVISVRDRTQFPTSKFKGLLSDESTVFNCRPVADNKQYVASLHAGHKKGVISVRDRTQFPTSITKLI